MTLQELEEQLEAVCKASEGLRIAVTNGADAEVISAARHMLISAAQGSIRCLDQLEDSELGLGS